eukprot:5735124-Amphidinium_carterae.1
MSTQLRNPSQTKDLQQNREDRNAQHKIIGNNKTHALAKSVVEKHKAGTLVKTRKRSSHVITRPLCEDGPHEESRTCDMVLRWSGSTM